MKALAKIILLIVFVALIPSFVTGLATKLSGLSGNFIKETLVKQDAYTKLTELLFEYAKGDETLSGLTAFAKREFTAKYVQGKVEKFIDNTASWAKGATKEVPSISFAEVKDKLTKQNPQLVNELIKLSKEQEGKKSETEFDVDKFLASDFTIPFQEKDLMWIKAWYWSSTFGVFLIPILLAGILFGLYKLSDSRPSAFKWIGLTLILASLWLLPSVGLVFLIFGLARGLIGESPDLPKDIWPIIESLANPFTSAYQIVGVTVSVLLFVAGIACLVLSKKQPQKAQSKG